MVVMKRLQVLGCAAALAAGAVVTAAGPVEAGRNSRPSVSVSDATASEGDGSMTFEVSLDAPSRRAAVGIAFTQNRTAKARQDFQRTIRLVVIPAGHTSTTVTVPLIDDDVEEDDETFRLRVLPLFGARGGDTRGVGTIVDDDGPLTVNLIHINDHHSHLQEEDGELDLGTSVGEFEHVLGGFPRVVTKIQELEASLENPVKIHAGDAITGTLFYSLFGGTADAALMNEVCFDMLALGNHEFDDGDDGLASFIGDLNNGQPNSDGVVCDTPVIAANVVPEVGTPLAPDADTSLIQPYVIKEFDGQKVGFIGIDIKQKTEVSSSPFETTQFLDEVETAQAKVAELQEMGIENIVLVTHQQYSNDLDLAGQVSGIDAIVGGDSHSLLGDYGPFGLNPEGEYPTITTNADGDPVCVVQAWQYSYVVGELNLTFENGHVSECGGTPHLLVDAPFVYEVPRVDENGEPVLDEDGDQIIDDVTAEGPELEEILAAIEATPLIDVVAPAPGATGVLDTFAEQVDVLTQQVIGSASEDLCLNRLPGDTRSQICATNEVAASGAAADVNGGFIQQIVTDAFAARAFRADFALQNAGGVRIDIPEGDVSIGDVYTLLPFANTLVELELTGAEVNLALEQAVENFLVNGGSTGSYPYGSSLRWDLDLNQAFGERFTNVEVKQDDGTWVAIDQAATYVVATNSFIASGRDGYFAFGVAFEEGRVVDTFIDYAQGFIDYLEQDVNGVLTVPAPEDFSTQTFIPVASAT